MQATAPDNTPNKEVENGLYEDGRLDDSRHIDTDTSYRNEAAVGAARIAAIAASMEG
jgi:hypothetical protein